MWFCNPVRFPVALVALRNLFAGGLMLGLAACTVEPLNGSFANNSDGSLSRTSTHALLASATVDQVSTRVAQQVRNKLLFALNGGNPVSGGTYRIRLDVRSVETKLLIGRDNLAPTAAQAVLYTAYDLIDTRTGKIITSGKRRVFASYDRTPQSFSNERAFRDAENRAAAETAQQIRLALAQAVAGR